MTTWAKGTPQANMDFMGQNPMGSDVHNQWVDSGMGQNYYDWAKQQGHMTVNGNPTGGPGQTFPGVINPGNPGMGEGWEQPPMPTVPEGMAQAMVMPAPVWKGEGPAPSRMPLKVQQWQQGRQDWLAQGGQDGPSTVGQAPPWVQQQQKLMQGGPQSVGQQMQQPQNQLYQGGGGGQQQGSIGVDFKGTMTPSAGGGGGQMNQPQPQQFGSFQQQTPPMNIAPPVTGYAGGGIVDLAGYAGGGPIEGYGIGGFFKGLAKAIGGVATGLGIGLIPGIGPALAMGLGSGLFSGITEGSLKKGLLSGIMGYVGGKGILGAGKAARLSDMEKAMGKPLASIIEPGLKDVGLGAGIKALGSGAGRSGLLDSLASPKNLAFAYPQMGELSSAIGQEDYNNNYTPEVDPYWGELDRERDRYNQRFGSNPYDYGFAGGGFVPEPFKPEKGKGSFWIQRMRHNQAQEQARQAWGAEVKKMGLDPKTATGHDLNVGRARRDFTQRHGKNPWAGLWDGLSDGGQVNLYGMRNGSIVKGYRRGGYEEMPWEMFGGENFEDLGEEEQEMFREMMGEGGYEDEQMYQPQPYQPPPPPPRPPPPPPEDQAFVPPPPVQPPPPQAWTPPPAPPPPPPPVPLPQVPPPGPQPDEFRMPAGLNEETYSQWMGEDPFDGGYEGSYGGMEDMFLPDELRDHFETMTYDEFQDYRDEHPDMPWDLFDEMDIDLDFRQEEDEPPPVRPPPPPPVVDPPPDLPPPPPPPPPVDPWAPPEQQLPYGTGDYDLSNVNAPLDPQGMQDYLGELTGEGPVVMPDEQAQISMPDLVEADVPVDVAAAMAAQAPPVDIAAAMAAGATPPPGMAEGGEVESQNRVRQMAVQALMGQLPHTEANTAIQKFIELFGQPALHQLMQMVTQMKSEQQGKAPVTEGMISGPGGGLGDQIVANVDGADPVALSSGEFIVPADVVSGLGDGDSATGADKLHQMMDQVRQQRTGSAQQAPPLRDQGLPTLG